MFGSVSKLFANLRHVRRCKTCFSGLNAQFKGTELRSIHATPSDPKWCLGVFESISLTFRHVTRCKTCVSGLNAQFKGTKLRSIHATPSDPKWCLGVFESISLTFRAWMHYLKVPSCEASILLHSSKMMFGSVSEHFANLQHVKKCKTCVSGLNALFKGTELQSIHSTPLDPKWCLGVFRPFR
jgi:acid stress-induced BolA-like protein IbaG/YrbA